MKGGKKRPEFGDAELVSVRIQEMLAKGEVDVVTLVYNRFVGVMSQVPTELRLIPMAPDKDQVQDDEHPHPEAASYEFEPDEDEILARLLPRALSIQIYRAMLDNEAGMDAATRNAGDMIKRLTLNYNRARQANITSELVEIISGAEAV